MQTMTAKAGLFVSLARAGLLPEELQRNVRELQKVDVEGINSAAKRTIQWDGAVVVLVGDLAQMEAEVDEVKELELGTPTIVDPKALIGDGELTNRPHAD